MHAPQPSTEQRALYKEILSSSGIYGLGLLAQRVGSILLLPLYTRYLTPRDYGLLELLDLSIVVFSMLFGANFSAALSYHYFEASPAKRNTVVGTTMTGATMLGATGALIGISASPLLSLSVFGTPTYAGYLRILFLQFAFSLPLEACFCWLRTINRPRLFVSFSIVRLLLSVGLNVYYLVVLAQGVSGFLTASCLATALLAGVGCVFCIARNGIAFDWGLFVRLFRYSLTLSLGGAALFIMNFGDRFLLQRFTSLAQIGIYSLAYKMAMLISYLHSSFHTYWTSQMYRLAQAEAFPVHLQHIFTYLVLVLVSGGLFIVVASGAALHLLTTQPFYAAGELVPILVLAYLVRAVGDYFRCILYIHNLPGRDALLNWLGAVVCIGGYLLLIPSMGTRGAALATLIAFTVVAVQAFRWARLLSPFGLEWRRLSTVVASATIVLLLRLSIHYQSFYAELALIAGLFGLYVLLLVALHFPSETEKRIFRGRWLGQFPVLKRT